jgi:hypothetical protein
MNLYFFPIFKEQPIFRCQTAEANASAWRSLLISDGAATGAGVVEVNGIEPMTPCLQSRCSPS